MLFTVREMSRVGQVSGAVPSKSLDLPPFYFQMYQSLLDKSVPYLITRWVVFGLLIIAFIGRIVYAQVRDVARSRCSPGSQEVPDQTRWKGLIPSNRRVWCCLGMVYRYLWFIHLSSQSVLGFFDSKDGSSVGR